MSELKSTRIAFTQAMMDLAEKDPRIVMTCSDSSKVVKAEPFMEKYPDRFFDFGIAEQNTVTSAAAMASCGLIPFLATYAGFISMRACEQVRTFTAYPGLNVKFIGANGGMAGGEREGVTHQFFEDLGIMRSIPGITVMIPADANQVYFAVKAAAAIDGPVYIRIGSGRDPVIYDEKAPFEYDKINVLKNGTDVALFGCGGFVLQRLLEAAKQLACEGIFASVIDVHTISPLDTAGVTRILSETGCAVTAEDNNINGGLGSAICEAAAENCPVPIVRLGLNNCYAESGLPDQLLDKYGLSVTDIVRAARKVFYAAGKTPRSYFHKVRELTGSELWVNNPQLSETIKAIRAGAVCCTTNPTFSMKALQGEDAPYAARILRSAAVLDCSVEDAALQAQEWMVARILPPFVKIYEETNGQRGFVSIQGDPFNEDDPDVIVAQMESAFKLGKNIIAKIPTTVAGIEAIYRLVKKNRPVIATEIMSVSQMASACEAYKKASSESGFTPPFYVTHITGIFDQWLAEHVKAAGIEVSENALSKAGLIIARKQFALMKERDYPGTLLGGGARGTKHFTGILGGGSHITLNWKGLTEDLCLENPDVEQTIFTPEDESAANELLSKIPEYKLAYQEGALKPEDYSDYGPVKFFRDSFEVGFKYLREAIIEARKPKEGK